MPGDECMHIIRGIVYVPQQTPPVTPRDNSRGKRIHGPLSPAEGTFTPAKVDDICRPSCIRIPATKHRSPVLSFKQPVLVERTVTTPPYAKRRKLSASEEPSVVVHSKPDMTPVKGSSTDKGFRTPPGRARAFGTTPPLAPRKPSKKHRSPALAAADCDGLLVTARRLSFGTEQCFAKETRTPVDWDSFSLDESPKHELGIRSRCCRDLASAIRVICCSGLEADGQCRLSELRAVLAERRLDTDIVIDYLRVVNRGWIRISRAGRVAFPGLCSAGEVIRSLIA